MPPLGLIANPASGKDIRRLVARASVFDNQEKQAIVRRLLVGALAVGAEEFRFFDDRHGILRSALSELGASLEATPIAATATGTALDTISAARALEDAGCGAVISLGGDGTNRALALGWRSAPLLPLSTGTNNVFPVLTEATVAGMAAGLVAMGQVPLSKVSRQCKVIDIEVEGERDDLALIDAVLSAEQFVGARALLEPAALRELLLTRADPAAVGMTSIGGARTRLADDEDQGLKLTLNADAGHWVHAPIAPGLFHDVLVSRQQRVALKRRIRWQGPGVLAFDGERERLLGAGQSAWLRVSRSGPHVINVQRTLALAAEKRLLAR